MTFIELRLAPELIAALEQQQISRPTPIQSAALPVLLDGRDAYLHAETGTGKTLAYLLPIFCRLDIDQAVTQAVILAPTHELAIQIHRQCCELAQNSGWPVRSLLLIGGTSTDRQIEKLKKKPHVVVGSPGRIAELLGRGKLKAQHLRTIVIDEADRLLSEASLLAARAIVQAAPRTRQLIFASATLERQSTEIVKEWAPEVLMLEARAAAVNENIEHLYLVCEERDKPDELRKLLRALAPERAIVFVHRNDAAEKVALRLAHHKIPAADLNAALGKEDRKRAMDGFRKAEIQVLIASDIAARGLDIKGVTHVFNFDVPTLSQAYLHRAGRTGRAGARGLAVTLMTEVETRLVRRYEEELGIEMRCVRMRDGKMVPAGSRS
ncbi:DEAD/DEAH box helicase [Peristeroidobacter agariperforans]|uniref:DEAD/DEAH box helicase n=1 Tax=Peristeroidobacter agariperforans TaxID=268404 RepID=UPI00101DFEE6|nr:DEAD/DEAH box helicase [Peristeroidobacter agariperforans]